MTTEDLVARLEGLEVQCARLASQSARQLQIIEALLDRVTDQTHLSYSEISRIENISKTSARRRYGQWLEVIPGTKQRGVPRHRLQDGWVPARIIRAANRNSGGRQ